MKVVELLKHIQEQNDFCKISQIWAGHIFPQLTDDNPHADQIGNPIDESGLVIDVKVIFFLSMSIVQERKTNNFYYLEKENKG